MKKHFEKLFFIIQLSILCGCMVGPDYENPNETIGEKEILDFQKFSNADGTWKEANPKDVHPRDDWWSAFDDPILSTYIENCRKDNPDLKSLFYKVEQARENARMKESALYPHAGASADWLKTEVGDHSILRPLGSQFEDWAVGATLTWDADLFGRIRSVLAASRADAQALECEYENALLALQTRVAALYFSLREFEAEKILLEKTVKIRETQTAFVRNRVEIESASKADLQRAVEQEYSTKAHLTDIAERIALAKNLLANLMGTSPAKIKILAAPLKGTPPEIPLTVPSTLLERRADIAAAERAVCAANYKIGAAQAAFYPTISITSSLGTESTAFSKLLDTSSFAWGVSPQIYVPIFQAGRLVAQKRVALAKHKQTLEEYRSVVLKAVRETEDALAKITLAKRRSQQRQIAAQAAAKVDKITQAQYEDGVADYFVASEAHRYALINELSLIGARGEEFRAAIELIRALGGSWKNKSTPTEKSKNNAVDFFEKI